MGRVIYSTRLDGDIDIPGLTEYSVLALKIAAICNSSTALTGVERSDDYFETAALISDLGGSVYDSNGKTYVKPVSSSEEAYLSLFNSDLIGISEYCENEDFFHDGDIFFTKKISDKSLIAVLIGLVFFSHKANVMLDFLPDDKEFVDLAVGLINSFGGVIEINEYKQYNCSCVNKLIGGGNIILEGDWNIAAFGLMCGALGNKINVKGVNGAFSVQHGAGILSPLKRMGYTVEKGIDGTTLRVTRENELFSSRIDALECPEFLPYMILLGALGDGNVEIFNVGDKLTDEQSERIVNSVAEFAKLGVKFIETGDGSFKINGANAFEGGLKLECYNDYIITTTMILATLCCKKSNTIINFDVVLEKYPELWKMFESIGGFSENI